MSHFGREQMSDLQAQFVAGCQRPAPDGPGFARHQAERLWEQVVAFAGYGFNQGHATSYAAVSYRMAYLKAHWPAAFLCARLAERGGFHHPIIYQAEAARLGLDVRPPHVNYSETAFTLTWEAGQAILWMGLGQVRDLRQASVHAIIQERGRRPFSSLGDLSGRVCLQPKEITHLIQCGALDGLGESRAALLAEEDEIRRAGSSLQMVFDLGSPLVAPESPAQRLAWEQHLLGQPVSLHPLELLTDRLSCTPFSPDAIGMGRQRAQNVLIPLREVAEHPGRIAVAAVRLPGWTGGEGFFLGDGEVFVVARADPARKAPPAWQPVLVKGRWTGDEWGCQWLHVDSIVQLGIGE
jgi:DNA polymerase III alpha subunit